MKLLRGEERKAITQIKPGLRTEYRMGACAGPVGFILALFQHQTEQLVILLHNEQPHSQLGEGAVTIIYGPSHRWRNGFRTTRQDPLRYNLVSAGFLPSA